MKTPEEIKKGLECCNTYNDCQNCPYDKADGSWACTVERNADALAYIQQLEAAQPKWISVEERLPEEGARVMVYFDGVVAVSEIIDTDMISGEPIWSFTGAGGDPTHWMPLPEPPKEKK